MKATKSPPKAERSAGPRSSAGTLGLRLGRFSWRVVRNFFRNKGVLLSSAVGYNALLSIIPLLAITLVALTHFYDEGTVSTVIVARVRPLAPGLAPAAREAITSFLANRELVGWGGLVTLVVVSSVAFRMLEQAMAVIFRRPRKLRPRRLSTSILIQFAYVPTVGLGVALLTGLTIGLGTLGDGELFGVRWFSPLAGALPTILRLASFAVMLGLVTSFYLVLPVVRVSVRHALVGAAVATALWEVLNRLLTWFFDNLSLVNVLYGSLGTIIVVLVSMEVFAGIFLLSAQLVAELDRSSRAGLRWYQAPPELPPLSVAGI